MRKLKIYLDTSVISHLDHADAQDKMTDTNLLWKKIRSGTFDVVISDVTIDELSRCHSPKREELFRFLSLIDYQVIESDDLVERVAGKFIDFGILFPGIFVTSSI